MSDHMAKLVGQFRNLVGQCPMTDSYFQHCFISWTLMFYFTSRIRGADLSMRNFNLKCSPFLKNTYIHTYMLMQFEYWIQLNLSFQSRSCTSSNLHVPFHDFWRIRRFLQVCRSDNHVEFSPVLPCHAPISWVGEVNLHYQDNSWRLYFIPGFSFD